MIIKQSKRQLNTFWVKNCRFFGTLLTQFPIKKQVDQEIRAPCLADDLRAAQGVDMLHTAHRLARPDAIGVVLEFQEGLPAVAAHLYQLPPVPREIVPVEGGGVADDVVRNGRAVHRGQLIAPRRVSVGVGFLRVGQRGQRSGGGVRIGLLARVVAGFIVGVYVGLAEDLVILAEKLALMVGCPYPQRNALRVRLSI